MKSSLVNFYTSSSIVVFFLANLALTLWYWLDCMIDVETMAYHPGIYVWHILVRSGCNFNRRWKANERDRVVDEHWRNESNVTQLSLINRLPNIPMRKVRRFIGKILSKNGFAKGTTRFRNNHQVRIRARIRPKLLFRSLEVSILIDDEWS